MDTKKLRQKILDLAIRGKLVPQDPNDEPASVLLERIKAEKEQLIKEGKIKRPKKTSTSDKSHYENIPFEIPEGWVWCTTDDLAYVASGSTPSKDAFVKKGIPYIKMYNLRKQSIDFEFQPQYIKEEVHNGKLQRSKTKVGDLIMNIVGPPLGKLAIIPPTLPESNFNQAAVLIRPHLHKDIIVQYLFYYLSEMSEINSISTKGSAGQLNISLTQSQNMRIALPPLNEQKRIIAEIKKWNNIIEIIESEKDDIEKSIIKTKSKILDLAIQGKLVPQDPTDEPAIELLKRINPNFEPCDNSHYENVPDGWEIVRFKDVFKSLSTREHQIQQKEIAEIGEIPVISQSANYIEGYSNQKDKTIYPQNGVIIFGDHTRVVKYIDFPFIVGADGVKIIQTNIYDKFAYYLILYTSLIIENKGYSRHFQFLSKSEYIIPPLEEQKRIANKISKIWSMIDTITAEL